MSKTIIWAYIFMSSASMSNRDHIIHKLSDGSVLHVYGTNSIGEACSVAKQFLEVEMGNFIELCGAFGKEETEEIRKAVKYKIPVGTVLMSDYDSKLFKKNIH